MKNEIEKLREKLADDYFDILEELKKLERRFGDLMLNQRDIDYMEKLNTEDAEYEKGYE